ncbi:uncharacterized protein PFL1_01071 [Pseudozyma flocculosa PF-1]|uniref:Uncharacterized protein n=1 Tax=Pseudozyma flocculosa TaxID=84751 RepID=A0A5C3FBV4_9BASI|nr:uncharacterized protein PFL1_01071 [Pseudozyma flocculosa PF-1]EPQ31739.1 hypothetical protein PFL1_01071 [Pseudozyma flocculosa PF-1]SPO41872.1 uncharacterized protein PSFLO_07354 [Pseudozyma flocculosa]
MPVPTSTTNSSTAAAAQGDDGKNIWIAAGEGDLERVKYLVDERGISPTAADEFTYTPLHAAASYGHLDILRFLLSHPSAPSDAANTTDSDGDTPLFVCETVEAARVLIDEFKADPKWKNNEGDTPASSAFENEHEDLATYLRSLTGEPEPVSPLSDQDDDDEDDDDKDDEPAPQRGAIDTTAHLTQREDDEADAIAEAQTDALMEKVGEILQRHEDAGTDPEDELRDVVGEVVVRQIMEGLQISSPGPEPSGP